MRLTRKAFDKWLSEQPHQKRFNMGHCEACALHHFLGPKSVIDFTSYTINGRERPMPPWAEQFQRQAYLCDYEVLVRMSPSRALKLLRSIP